MLNGSKYHLMMAAAAVLVMAPALTGCGGGEPPVEIPQLLDLPEEERTAALSQRVCPVDGELLGSKGTPLKVTIRDQEVFVCSAECEGELKQNPQQYLEVLEAAETE